MLDERVVISLLSLVGILENVLLNSVTPISSTARTVFPGNEETEACILRSIRPIVYEVKLVLDSEVEHVNGQVVSKFAAYW